MSRSIDDLLPEKPEPRPRIYAYSIGDEAHAGWLKIGQTTKDVKTRVAAQLKTAAIKNYKILLDEPAERDDGTRFTDHEVRLRLRSKGHANPELEWMKCTIADVLTVITELRSGGRLAGSHHATFTMRPEQAEAVRKTAAYFQSIWNEGPNAVPRFLWNAKMRFGKTFATYQLARTLAAMRVLIVTFKPAVEDAWQNDLESHTDFDGWQYFSKTTEGNPADAATDRPLVYFGSFQDLLGKDAAGNIKAKNEWLHAINWDLVVFDEYHFGAWRDRAKELFEGEDTSEAKKEAAAEYNPGLDNFNEELDVLRETEDEFLPITTRAYLYLSGTPFKALRRASSLKSRYLTGRTPTSSGPSSNGRRSTPGGGIRTGRCRRCGC